MISKYNLLYIEWCDAVHNMTPWLSEEDAKEWSREENWIVCQAGFLIEETDEYILLASKQNLYDQDNPEIGGILKIPVTWIRKRVDLTQSVQ